MTLTQIFIVLAGLFIGYRLVSYMLSPGTGDADNRSHTPPDQHSGSDEDSRSRARAEQDRSILRPLDSERAWHQTLGVTEWASKEEIERAYRQQISQYHPDKVAALGEDIRRLAEERTKEINAAYDTAMRIGH